MWEEDGITCFETCDWAFSVVCLPPTRVFMPDKTTNKTSYLVWSSRGQSLLVVESKRSFLDIFTIDARGGEKVPKFQALTDNLPTSDLCDNVYVTLLPGKSLNDRWPTDH